MKEVKSYIIFRGTEKMNKVSEPEYRKIERNAIEIVNILRDLHYSKTDKLEDMLYDILEEVENNLGE